VAELLGQGLRVGWLTFAAPAFHQQEQLRLLCLPEEPAAFAAQLYAALHAFEVGGVERIVVTMPPVGELSGSPHQAHWLPIRSSMRSSPRLAHSPLNHSRMLRSASVQAKRRYPPVIGSRPISAISDHSCLNANSVISTPL